MTKMTDPTDAAIQDARALLQTLMSSDWHEVHVRSGEAEIFIARDGGGANPMRGPSPIAAVEPASPVAAKSEPSVVVTAPHVASLTEVLPVGAVVSAGQTVATLRVLVQSEAVEAPVAGVIASVDAAAGDLLDFKAPILSITQIS